ncbi:MAE_28990/MAE_18760 family HEPN-like nuclease [Candidatus Marithioploca araucensis]|uniref:MAE_28990/MAE_18760 family HEPN-like nuclease n=1 Tax=Candidatus Marithioploca araucensis TaxID=70273 RepID=A0ABT7VW75_9GAMM|nr:MAE_28990/MAE_18760 family HEPN-like nuclease [Candidatus Marithioploca araucensis]
MQEIIKEFEQRVKDVEQYLHFLKQVHKPQEECAYGEIDENLKRILRANAYIIIYNMVEYSIRYGILEIYQEMKLNKCTYSTIRQEIRDIWLNEHYRKIFKVSANWESARKTAAQLVEKAVNNVIISLDEEAIPISGNLDARQIRLICEAHGISYQTHPDAKGGVELLTVKKQRNSLAHGNISFSECGHKLGLEQLEKIKSEIVTFVRDILANIMDYIDKKKYERANVS